MSFFSLHNQTKTRIASNLLVIIRLRPAQSSLNLIIVHTFDCTPRRASWVTAYVYHLDQRTSNHTLQARYTLFDILWTAATEISSTLEALVTGRMSSKGKIRLHNGAHTM